MICQKCAKPNPDENNFCGQCGAPLPAPGRITLKEVLDAGLLKADDELTINFRGNDITANLLADGKIMYQNQSYAGPLAGATAVRRQTCDGWYCWRVVDHTTGKSHTISHYRSALLKQRGENR
ncbi:zinc-ribbon domain-containing protein [Chloroflexota bacterium]